MIFASALNHVSFILRDKSSAAATGYIYDEENSIDVLFLGTSVTNSGISPLDLWNQYGIVSYNAAQNGQGIGNSYYSLKSILHYQSPKLVVMDLAYIDRDSSSAMIHEMVDNLPYGITKIEAAYSLGSLSEMPDYLIPVTYYHARWDEISKRDYTLPDAYNRGGVIGYISVGSDGETFDTSAFAEPLVVVPQNKTEDIDDMHLKYIYKIVDLCRANDVEILFINYPCYAWGETNHGDGESLQRKWNKVGQLLDIEGVPFLNGIQLAEEIGFDYTKDLRDWRHLSGYGNQKITCWIGQYIMNNYEVEDRRGEPALDYWNEDYLAWRVYADGIKKNQLGE